MYIFRILKGGRLNNKVSLLLTIVLGIGATFVS